MSLLVLKAYWALIRFDLSLAHRDFAALYNQVRVCPLAPCVIAPDAIEQISSAINIACIWYWKQVHCLQRSAATTCLLRHYGINAQMTIGVQQIPFRAHAWVEVDGQVVNDKTYVRQMYGVLDRC
jgi:hypothetical protein